MTTMDKMLSEVARVVNASTVSISRLGAQHIVLEKFFATAVLHLTPEQRRMVAVNFRNGVEQALAAMDDVSLPAEYHTTFLRTVNEVLSELE